MAAIHVTKMSTKLLDTVWIQGNLEKERDTIRLRTLNEFVQSLTDSLHGGKLFNSQVQWVINKGSNQYVKEFAEKQNQENNF